MQRLAGFKRKGRGMNKTDIEWCDLTWNPVRGSRNPSSPLCGEIMVRIGKKAAGRLLDGREYLEFPEAIAKVMSWKLEVKV